MHAEWHHESDGHIWASSCTQNGSVKDSVKVIGAVFFVWTAVEPGTRSPSALRGRGGPGGGSLAPKAISITHAIVTIAVRCQGCSHRVKVHIASPIQSCSLCKIVTIAVRFQRCPPLSRSHSVYKRMPKCAHVLKNSYKPYNPSRLGFRKLPPGCTDCPVCTNSLSAVQNCLQAVPETVHTVLQTVHGA